MTASGNTRAAEVTQLESQLQHRLAGRVRELRLLVRDQAIVLQGRAHTYHAKQIAQHAVMETAGLPIVASEIEVI